MSTRSTIGSARDRPEKAESIEIYNAAEYQKMRLHYNGSGLILHELCHIIHQKVLPGGLYNDMVIDIHKIAKEGGRYSRVLRRDWALRAVDSDTAYCTVNHKEFFAELSVAYLADCYRDLDGSAATVMLECSPPFISPAVIERIRQKAPETGQTPCSGEFKVASRMNGTVVVPHCSRFFPFTQGQLLRYDPQVFECFASIWQYVEGWKDPKGKCCFGCGWV